MHFRLTNSKKLVIKFEKYRRQLEKQNLEKRFPATGDFKMRIGSSQKPFEIHREWKSLTCTTATITQTREVNHDLYSESNFHFLRIRFHSQNLFAQL